MKKETFKIIASILGLVALVFASTASVFLVNQPKVPSELLKK